MGNRKLYLKNATVIEQMAKVDTIVFDKTGTITTNKKSEIVYEGEHIDAKELAFIRSLLRGSNHPLSRRLYEHLPASQLLQVEEFEELTGKGIHGYVNGYHVKVGSATFTGAPQHESLQTLVHISINRNYVGRFIFQNQYRDGLPELFKAYRQNIS
jgi:Cu+-exporting ATPase